MKETFANFAVFIPYIFFIVILVLVGVIRTSRKNFRKLVTERDSYRKLSKEYFERYAMENDQPKHILCRVIDLKFDRHEQDDDRYGYYVWLGVKTSPEGVTQLLSVDQHIMRLDNSQLPKDCLGCPKWHYATTPTNAIVMLGETYTLLAGNSGHYDYCKAVYKTTIVS